MWWIDCPFLIRGETLSSSSATFSGERAPWERPAERFAVEEASAETQLKCY